MNNQQVFDTVVRHLYTQRKQAVSATGACKYRAPSGLKCAVGCLIPDDKYDPRMEFISSGMESVMRDAGIHMRHATLLSELQWTHDSSSNWDDTGPTDEMKLYLSGIAKTFRLKTTVLDEVTA